MKLYTYQGLGIREQALYELRQERKIKKQEKTFQHQYWVKVGFTDGTTKWYQCSRDLQGALWSLTKKHHGKTQSLNGFLINVPISGYDKNGHASIITGVVLETKIKNQRTHDTSRITRSQICNLSNHYNKLGWRRLKEVIRYMQHDYDNDNKQQIAKAISNLMPKLRSSLPRFLSVGEMNE